MSTLDPDARVPGFYLRVNLLKAPTPCTLSPVERTHVVTNMAQAREYFEQGLGRPVPEWMVDALRSCDAVHLVPTRVRPLGTDIELGDLTNWKQSSDPIADMRRGMAEHERNARR